MDPNAALAGFIDAAVEGDEWGEDSVPDDVDGWEPDEEDGFVFSTTLGTEASLSGKSLGVFEDEDEAEQAIKAEGKRSGYYPNVWRVSDHGNHHLVENFWTEDK